MSADTEWVLADLVSFTPEGRSVLFVRPREPLTDAQYSSLADSVARLRIPGVITITVPANLELMALTEGQMEQIGYTRVPVAPAEEAPLYERTAP